MIKRNATVNWKGAAKEGEGLVSLQSGRMQNAPYSYSSRFEDGRGTNPEELVAAGHAACFTMQVSFKLKEAGFNSDTIDTTCTLDFESGSIKAAHLKMEAHVPNIPEKQFAEIVEWSKINCPISKLLNTQITLEATLI